MNFTPRARLVGRSDALAPPHSLRPGQAKRRVCPVEVSLAHLQGARLAETVPDTDQRWNS